MANGISNDVNGHLPAGASQLPAAALSAATNPQVLTNPAYHDQVVANAVKYGGPAAQGMLEQIFTALKHSLAVGIGEGMVVVLGFSLVMLAATLFLKNVPLRSGWGPAAERAGGSAGGSSGGSEWGQATSGATPSASGAASWGQGSGNTPSGGTNWSLGSADGGRPEPGSARRT